MDIAKDYRINSNGRNSDNAMMRTCALHSALRYLTEHVADLMTPSERAIGKMKLRRVDVWITKRLEPRNAQPDSIPPFPENEVQEGFTFTDAVVDRILNG